MDPFVEGTTYRLVWAEIIIADQSNSKNEKTLIILGKLATFCLTFTYKYGFKLPMNDFDVMLSKSSQGTRISMSWLKFSCHQA